MGTQSFEWDENKNQSNIQKHGLSFKEASAVFNDVNRLIIPDNRQDYGEIRINTIGEITLATQQPLLIITLTYTDRNGITRIISARKASKKERYFYVQSKQIL